MRTGAPPKRLPCPHTRYLARRAHRSRYARRVVSSSCPTPLEQCAFDRATPDKSALYLPVILVPARKLFGRAVIVAGVQQTQQRGREKLPAADVVGEVHQRGALLLRQAHAHGLRNCAVDGNQAIRQIGFGLRHRPDGIGTDVRSGCAVTHGPEDAARFRVCVGFRAEIFGLLDQVERDGLPVRHGFHPCATAYPNSAMIAHTSSFLTNASAPLPAPFTSRSVNRDSSAAAIACTSASESVRCPCSVMSSSKKVSVKRHKATLRRR